MLYPVICYMLMLTDKSELQTEMLKKIKEQYHN